jgi:hypothetical protein
MGTQEPWTTREGEDGRSQPFSMRISRREARALAFLADVKEITTASDLLRSMNWTEIVDEYDRRLGAARALDDDTEQEAAA